MRKFQKKQITDIIQSLHELHHQIKKKLEQKNIQIVQNALNDCQTVAIQIGEAIEQIEGEGTEAVAYLEQYCERVYQVSLQVEEIVGQKAFKYLEEMLIKAENAIQHMPERIEVVFLPYKVSMWDSLDSVWMAAESDKNCDAYVIPIPFYDKNPNGSFNEEHYEGNEYPDYVPVTHYNNYDFENRRPDAIFIHNPYDQFNNVTSVHPFFYSKNLKQFTDMLVYIPYYSTSGGMSEGQSHCMAYYYADYIVMQAEKYRKFYDPNLPKEKLLPLGSPKFDKVIRICNNPPELPIEWKEKLAGKKVYFYNTSINGMLANTAAFLKKMEYVFKCFAGRTDACLIWRPHPLLESTFESMRVKYKPVYDALKRYYLESNFGIYDDTPEITNTIALCDAYIGDAGTSVTSLFGIAGKPIFILNNYINTLPEEDDWRGEVIKSFYAYGNDEWMVTQGNKLYHAQDGNYHYKYFCDLSDYAYGDYYTHVIKVNGKNYVCPGNAQNILLIGENGIDKKIGLEHRIESKGAFCGAIGCDAFLFLIPKSYPAIVRYDTITGEIKYFNEYLDIITGMVQGEKKTGGFCAQNGYLFIASPTDNRVLAIHAQTGKQQILTTNAETNGGCMLLQSDGTDLWFLPYTGTKVVRWNPNNGDVKEYDCHVEGMQCEHPMLGYTCEDRPFHFAAFNDKNVFLTPCWGNKYVKLNKQTGKVTEWDTAFYQPKTIKNGYYLSWIKGYFCPVIDRLDKKERVLFSVFDRKLYSINLMTDECREIEIKLDGDELQNHEAGFQENSEWMQYACQENAFTTLPDFLNGNITGNAFNRERQIKAYSDIAANNDGTSGEKIYRFVSDKLLR